MKEFGRWVLAGALLAVAACGDSPSPAETARLEALQAQVASLEQRLARVQASKDIKLLQAAFGFYADKALWDEAANLFADDGTLEVGLDGVYSGKARIREYLYAFGGGKQGLSDGELTEYMQVMPVITVAADGMTAKGRWRSIIMTGKLGESALWGEGPDENDYVNDGGVWKIKSLHWYDSFLVPYESGWLETADPTGGKFVTSLTPDAPPTVEYKTWPDTYLPPFHFPNPVKTYVAHE